MNIVGTCIAILIVIVGIYFNKTKSQNSKSEVLSHESRDLPSPTLLPTPTITETPTPTPFPTNTPITPINTPFTVSSNISEYRYPGSSIINLTDNSMLLRSTDDPKVVTEWYKNKINSQGMNVKTFVQTSANSNILNKLVGAKASFEVRIEITKNVSDSVTQIAISIET